MPSPSTKPLGVPFAVHVAIVLVGLVIASGGVVTVIAQRSAENESHRMADELFREVSRHAVDQVREFVGGSTAVLRSCQSMGKLRTLPLEDDDRLADQLLALLRANEGLSWVSFADETGRFVGVTRLIDGSLGTNQSHIGPDGRTTLVEWTVDANLVRKGKKVTKDGTYDPRKRPFYAAAIAAGGNPVWMDPYIFYGQNVPGITVAAALIENGKPRGVFTVDLALAQLTSRLATLRASELSELILFTDSGQLIAPTKINRTTSAATTAASDSSLPLLTQGDALLRSFAFGFEQVRAKTVAPGKVVRFSIEPEGVRHFASATTVDMGNDRRWVVGITAPETDFLGAAWRTRRMVLASCGIIVLLATILAILFSRMISRPVGALREVMSRIGGGDLDAKADLGGAREFRQLSKSLNKMVGELRDGLRLRHSIAVAMQVQKQLLPEKPPRVPGIDVCGYSKYCDETGGDYYDFLTADVLGPSRLLFVVGDVMGHGVGSALVMASARAVLRDRATEVDSLASILDRLNTLVGADTRGKQFMTMSLGILDVAAGTYRFASAGHDPAIIYRIATGQFEEMDEAGLPLGVTDDGMYSEYTIEGLLPGDVLVLGTDGVWEARAENETFFGKDRIREVVQKHAPESAEKITAAMVAAVELFRGKEPAHDDTTFVIIKLEPSPETASPTATAFSEPATPVG